MTPCRNQPAASLLHRFSANHGGRERCEECGASRWCPSYYLGPPRKRRDAGKLATHIPGTYGGGCLACHRELFEHAGTPGELFCHNPACRKYAPEPTAARAKR